MEGRCLTVDLEPELLRGVPLHVALSGWAKHWADNGSGSLGTDSDSYSLSQQTLDFDNFLSHDWGTSRWEKLFAMMVLFNIKPASWVTLVVSIPTAVASVFVTRSVSVFLPVAIYICFWTVLCFAQRISALVSKPRMVFLDKLCISQSDAELKQKGILGLAGFLDCSKKLTILWSPRYFSRLWCSYELATFLRHSTQESIEIMPTKLAVLLFALFSGTQVASLVYFLAGTLLANEADGQSQRLIETATITGIMAICLVIASALGLYVGIGAMWSITVLEHQLKGFRIQDCKCFCCSCDHIHPETGAELPCDRALIVGTVRRWYTRRDTSASSPEETEDAADEPHLEQFNQTVRHELMPMVLDFLNRGQTCMSYFSPLVWAASLPSLVFWLPAYVENSDAFETFDLLVWWARCCLHWATFPVGILAYFRSFWLMCMLGVCLERYTGKKCRALVANLLVLPLLVVGMGPIVLVEFARAATVTPSLLPLLPFALLAFIAFGKRPCNKHSKSLPTEPMELTADTKEFTETGPGGFHSTRLGNATKGTWYQDVSSPNFEVVSQEPGTVTVHCFTETEKEPEEPEELVSCKF